MGMGKSKRLLLLKKRKLKQRPPDLSKSGPLQSQNQSCSKHKLRKIKRSERESPEDREIRELERLLGVKKKGSGDKLSSEFARDGLDCI